MIFKNTTISNTWIRIGTAMGLLLSLILVNFFVPEKIFFVCFSAAMLLAAWEWTQFVSQVVYIRLINLIILSAIAVFCFFKVSLLLIMLLAGVGWVYSIITILQKGHQIRDWWLLKSKISILLAGAWALIPMWMGGYDLHAKLIHGPQWFFILLLIVMGTDIGGYVVGKTLGRIKLAPDISPGKTIEGCVGGFIFAQIFAWIGLSGFGLLKISQSEWITVGLWIGIIFLVSGVSIIGDLFESLFKRISGIKDSGTLLPGHGGILDRIDGITAALPIFWIFKLLI